MYNQKNLQDLNLQNLLFISKILKKTEHFVFYGTLLGLTREQKIINGDDDIDLLIHNRFRNLVLKKMKSNKSFKLNKRVSNNYFIQYIKKKNNLTSFVDFYFYIKKPKQNYIIERHNFLSNIHDKNYSIHIPKKMVFPIKKSKKYKTISLPNNPKALCKFLYGSTWLSPLHKNTGYRLEIRQNKPLMIRRSFLGYLTRFVKETFSNKFKKK